MNQTPEDPEGRPEQKIGTPGDEIRTPENPQHREDEIPELQENQESKAYAGMVYYLILGVGGFICAIAIFFVLAAGDFPTRGTSRRLETKMGRKACPFSPASCDFGPCFSIRPRPGPWPLPS